MKRHPQFSQFLIGTVLTAFALTSGCTCSGDIEVDGDPAIAFLSPIDGEIISTVDSDGNANLTVTVSAVGDGKPRVKAQLLKLDAGAHDLPFPIPPCFLEEKCKNVNRCQPWMIVKPE